MRRKIAHGAGNPNWDWLLPWDSCSRDLLPRSLMVSLEFIHLKSKRRVLMLVPMAYFQSTLMIRSIIRRRNVKRLRNVSLRDKDFHLNNRVVKRGG